MTLQQYLTSFTPVSVRYALIGAVALIAGYALFELAMQLAQRFKGW
jgi:hypothetical protein